MPIQVEIVTPERLLWKDEADFVAAPAWDGEIGILPHHAPLLTRLGVGVLRLTIGSETKQVAISGGFLEVQQGSQVAIFAETAESAEEIDIERARQAAERAKEKLASADLTGRELAEVESALTRALLRIKLGQVVRRQPPRPEPIHTS